MPGFWQEPDILGLNRGLAIETPRVSHHCVLVHVAWEELKIKILTIYNICLFITYHTYCLKYIGCIEKMDHLAYLSKLSPYSIQFKKTESCEVNTIHIQVMYGSQINSIIYWVKRGIFRDSTINPYNIRWVYKTMTLFCALTYLKHLYF